MKSKIEEQLSGLSQKRFEALQRYHQAQESLEVSRKEILHIDSGRIVLLKLLDPADGAQ